MSSRLQPQLIISILRPKMTLSQSIPQPRVINIDLKPIQGVPLPCLTSASIPAFFSAYFRFMVRKFTPRYSRSCLCKSTTPFNPAILTGRSGCYSISLLTLLFNHLAHVAMEGLVNILNALHMDPLRYVIGVQKLLLFFIKVLKSSISSDPSWRYVRSRPARKVCRYFPTSKVLSAIRHLYNY
jgi:hypothetical protein